MLEISYFKKLDEEFTGLKRRLVFTWKPGPEIRTSKRVHGRLLLVPDLYAIVETEAPDKLMSCHIRGYIADTCQWTQDVDSGPLVAHLLDIAVQLSAGRMNLPPEVLSQLLNLSDHAGGKPAGPDADTKNVFDMSAPATRQDLKQLADLQMEFKKELDMLKQGFWEYSKRLNHIEELHYSDNELVTARLDVERLTNQVIQLLHAQKSTDSVGEEPADEVGS